MFDILPGAVLALAIEVSQQEIKYTCTQQDNTNHSITCHTLSVHSIQHTALIFIFKFKKFNLNLNLKFNLKIYLKFNFEIYIADRKATTCI